MCRSRSSVRVVNTSVLHDVEEGDHDAGDGLETRRRLSPPLRIHHGSQRVVQDPPPHRSLSSPLPPVARFTSRLRSASRRRRSRWRWRVGGRRQRGSEVTPTQSHNSGAFQMGCWPVAYLLFRDDGPVTCWFLFSLSSMTLGRPNEPRDFHFFHSFSYIF